MTRSSDLLVVFVVLTVMLTAVAMPTHSQECTDYQDYFHWSAVHDVSAQLVSLSEESSLLYTMQGNGTLRILDMSEPGPPQEIGMLEMAVQPAGLALAGEIVFIATGDDLVIPVNVSDPAAPYALDPFIFYVDLGKIRADGVVAAVVVGPGYIAVFDATDPLSPQRTLLELGNVYDLDVQDGFVYVANSRLSFVDARNPSAPYVPYGIWYSSDMSIRHVATIPGQAYCWGQWSDSYDTYNRFEVVDITDTFNTFLITSEEMWWEGFADAYLGLGTRVFSVDSNYSGVDLVQIDPWGADPFIRRFYTPVLDLGWTGTRVVISTQEHALLAFDPENITPAPYWTHDTASSSRDVVAKGDHVYLAHSLGTFTYDVSDPSAPLQTSFLARGQTVRWDVSGDLLVSAETNGGFMIFDISTPSTPAFVATAPCLGQPEHVVTAGDWAFAACGESGLSTMDISDPQSVQIVGWADTPVHATAVDVAGDLAAVADGSGSALLFDVSDPADPHIEALIGLYGTANDVQIEEDILYLAAEGEGVLVYDITQPSDPVLISSLVTDSPARRIEVADDLAYVCLGPQGVMMFDVSQPARPLSFGLLDIGDNPSVAVADGAIVFGHGVLITAPLPCGLMSDVAPTQPPRAGVDLVSNYPNPFNPSTTLRFSLAAASHARLTILDVKGRQVCTLRDGALDAGPHEVVWDGCDVDGSGVGSGVYFVRIETDLGAAAGRMTLIR